MGYKLEKCKACHRPFIAETKDVSFCPHCKDSEILALLTDPKWLRLDDKERLLYSDLNELNKKIDDVEARVKPKEKKGPMKLKDILITGIMCVLAIAPFVYGFIHEKNSMLKWSIAIMLLAAVFGFAVPAELYIKHNDKKHLMELEQERDNLYEKIADTQIKKASYREEWLAEKRKQSHSLTEDESKDA